jgi:3-dehydroquinate synthase
MFKFLEDNYKGILALEKDVVEKAVHDSIRIKSRIVNMDEMERGERRKLNFGHTIGHALEKVAKVSHGEAVSAGMVSACMISEKLGLLKHKDRLRVEELLTNLGLPVHIQADHEKLFEAMGKDKKRQKDRIHFVLLEGIGEAVIKEISISELQTLLSATSS